MQSNYSENNYSGRQENAVILGTGGPQRECTFRRDLATGKTGCDRVAAFFTSTGWRVVDVSDDPAWQKEDIDLLLYRPGSTSPVTVEVKTDKWPDINGTLSWEVISNIAKGTVGCCVVTTAEYMAFLSPQSGRLMLFRTDRMRRYISQNGENKWGLAYHKNEARWMPEGEQQTSISLKVPVESAMDAIGAKIYHLPA